MEFLDESLSIKETLERNGYIAVDLDGTLAMQDVDSAYSPSFVGEPVRSMLSRIVRWIASGKDVRILTARAASDNPAKSISLQAINDWCDEYLGRRLPISAEKDYRMTELWDDRAVQLVPNTGTPVQNLLAEAIDLLEEAQGGSIHSDLRDRILYFLNEHEGADYAVEK